MNRMTSKEEISVLMITGVYLPESNGAVLQCNQLISNLGKSIRFSVLTGTNDKASEGNDCVEGISVTRVLIPKGPTLRYIIGALRFFIKLLGMLTKTDLVHIHGFSRRNAIVMAISRIFNKKVILKMTSFGQDDPLSIKESFPTIFWQLFKCCHAYIGLSPAFAMSYQKADLPGKKYNFIPNGVDLDRYIPASKNEKMALREKYGFAEDDKIIIFVGHFSPEKRPMLVYRAWVRLCEQNICAKLIFVGHTKNHFEVDDEISETIKQDALGRGILPLIRFVEKTSHVDEYIKIADVFVLPSIREGLPNVLLEAMACALPCVVSDLPGVTDWLIDDGVTGVLFRSDNPDVLAGKITPYFAEHVIQRKMGVAARHFMESNFSCASTSQRVLDLYRKTMGQTSRAVDSF